MKNLKRLSKDILLAIDSLKYEKDEEKLLQAELLLNINRFLYGEEEYANNIAILRQAPELPEVKWAYYDDDVFTKVTDDVIKAIGALEYNEKSLLIDKVELMINISKFLSDQSSYYNNLRILSEVSINTTRHL